MQTTGVADSQHFNFDCKINVKEQVFPLNKFMNDFFLLKFDPKISYVDNFEIYVVLFKRAQKSFSKVSLINLFKKRKNNI